LQAVADRGLSGWNNIHKTGPAKAESHEMLFVFAFSSPLVTLLFPYFDELEEAIYADRLPPKARERLKRYFVDCLRRHIYATGPDKVLLEKVALIAGRLELVLEALPDARFVQLVRHPYQSVPSLVSMFRAPWPALAPECAAKDGEATQGVAQMIFTYYRTILRLRANIPDERYMELRYEDLVADPKAAVERVYEKFGLTMTDEMSRALEEEREKARAYRSTHAYSLEEYGLTKEQVRRELADVFEEYGFQE
jgi:hypothetical protein